MQERWRVKQTSPLNDRLIAWAEAVRKQAAKMAPGPQRDALLKKASQADTAAQGQLARIAAAEVAVLIDMQASLEKLRADAAEAVIRDMATDATKRELFNRLSIHLATLATEVERAMTARSANEKQDCRLAQKERPGPP